MARTVWSDLRLAARTLRKNWGFSTIAILTMVLGIGANATIFSVINGVLLRKLPYPRASQLVVLQSSNLEKGEPHFSVTIADFLDWRTRTQSFAGMAAYRYFGVTYLGGDAPERLRGIESTGGMFQILGVPPALGRDFAEDEFQVGKDHVAILSYGLWQQAFGGDRNAVGRNVEFNGEPYTIVGVMPRGFRFENGVDLEVEFWTPWALPPQFLTERSSHFLQTIARLKTGVSLTNAESEMKGISAQIEAQYPATNHGWSATVTSLQDEVTGDVRPALLLLMGAAGLVLLIACANVANMLLARGSGRKKEMAIRIALGAKRRQIVKQLLTENLLVAGVAGGVALLLEDWCTRGLIAINPSLMPRSGFVAIDLRVLFFTTVLVIGSGLIFGLAPAISASQTDVHEMLTEAADGRARGRVRRVLIALEVALAFILLAGASLLLRSFSRLRSVSPGFETGGVISFDVGLPSARYAGGPQVAEFFHSLLDRLQATPGVRSSALTTLLPLSGEQFKDTFVTGNQPAPPLSEQPTAEKYLVSPDYFRTLRIPLLSGREFSVRDAAGAKPVCIIDSALAQQYFANQDPVGHSLRVGVAPEISREIVGVVGTVKHDGLDQQDGAQIYLPFDQAPEDGATVLVAGSQPPSTMVPAIREAVRAVDPQQPITHVQTLDELLADTTALPKSRSVLLGIYAALAVLLAAIGLYGVMSYITAQNTKEIGIRMVLGARPSDVYRSVVWQGMAMTGLGAACGLLGTLWLAPLIKSLLFGVTAFDPVTLAGVPALLLGVSLIACAAPAWRAMRVDPMIALRHQ